LTTLFAKEGAMLRTHAPVAGRRPVWIAIGLMFVLLAAAPAQAQEAAAAANQRLFPADAGLVLNFIKADKTADFEEIMGKLKEALQKSTKPERKQQAASWKVYKSPDPAAGGNVLYVFVIDPSVKGADYTVSTILAEGFPAAEVNEMYKRYAEAFAQGMNFVNLALVQNLGQ
jgi:hypothetical protein